jgi:hypothetical protein
MRSNMNPDGLIAMKLPANRGIVTPGNSSITITVAQTPPAGSSNPRTAPNVSRTVNPQRLTTTIFG